MENDEPISVPVRGYLNDRLSDFIRLFEMCSIIRNSKKDILFTFDGCRFLAQNAVAFIGGLTSLALNEDRKVYYDLDGIRPEVRRHIETNGFLDAFKIGRTSGFVKGTSVPFRVDIEPNTNDFTVYLRDEWLGSYRIDLDDLLKDIIVSTVLEAYVNVFDHANSPVGVASCGQHFPNNQELDITLVDFGVGIPHNVRAFLGKPDMRATDALEWAFQPGNTTKKKTSAISRGLGLKELKRFIQRNHGKLEVYSADGYIVVDSDGERTQPLSNSFGGTVIQITLICDRNHYTLEDILPKTSDDEPLF